MIIYYAGIVPESYKTGEAVHVFTRKVNGRYVKFYECIVFEDKPTTRDTLLDKQLLRESHLIFMDD